MKTVIPGHDEQHLGLAVERFRSASCPVALTGAGISVGSGIPDFRSPGGLWSMFAPDEYATLDVFLHNPAKAWKLYRAMGRVLVGRKPNPAHLALAELESRGVLQGVITQNVDNLHQAAGSSRVFEIHGEHTRLHCIRCGYTTPLTEAHFSSGEIPECRDCGFALKPNVVLFGESVRCLEEILALIAGCDLLLVIGTSAQVFPAAELPLQVRRQGGVLVEFNREYTGLSAALSCRSPETDVFIQGDVCATLPFFVDRLTAEQGGAEKRGDT